MRKSHSTIEAMLKHARKRMQQRAQKPLAKHAGEIMPSLDKPAIAARSTTKERGMTNQNNAAQPAQQGAGRDRE